MMLHLIVGLLAIQLAFYEAKINKPNGQGTLALNSSLNSTLLLPPTPDTWKALNLDQYLINYPSGSTLSLQDYAFQHQAQQFICGIGQMCRPGQLGHPVQAPAWYILFAAKEYTAAQTYIHSTIEPTVSMIQDAAVSIVKNLYREKPRSLLFQPKDLFALASVVVASAAKHTVVDKGPASQVDASVLAAALAAGTSAVLGDLNTHHGDSDRPEDFTKWPTYAYYLAVWQTKVQYSMASSVDKTVQSGISTSSGIYSVLKGGGFLDSIQVNSTESGQKQLEDMLAVRLVVNVLRSQGGFVTYNYDKCRRKGPGGAWSGNHVLSYCKDGKMINIVRADGHKTQNYWHNAYLIQKKYHISTEYLVTQSVNCFFKYRTQNFDPYVNSTLPLDINADCVANLPVCDITRSEINHEIEHGSTTVAACSKYGVPMAKN